MKTLFTESVRLFCCKVPGIVSVTWLHLVIHRPRHFLVVSSGCVALDGIPGPLKDSPSLLCFRAQDLAETVSCRFSHLYLSRSLRVTEGCPAALVSDQPGRQPEVSRGSVEKRAHSQRNSRHWVLGHLRHRSPRCGLLGLTLGTSLRQPWGRMGTAGMQEAPGPLQRLGSVCRGQQNTPSILLDCVAGEAVLRVRGKVYAGCGLTPVLAGLPASPLSLSFSGPSQTSSHAQEAPPWSSKAGSGPSPCVGRPPGSRVPSGPKGARRKAQAQRSGAPPWPRFTSMPEPTCGVHGKAGLRPSGGPLLTALYRSTSPLP